MSVSTMLPAVMTAPSPMVTPGRTVTRPASHASAPISIGFATGAWPLTGASGISLSEMMQCWPIMTPRPILTRLRAEMMEPKLIQTWSPVSMRPPRLGHQLDREEGGNRPRARARTTSSRGFRPACDPRRAPPGPPRRSRAAPGWPSLSRRRAWHLFATSRRRSSAGRARSH